MTPPSADPTPPAKSSEGSSETSRSNDFSRLAEQQSDSLLRELFDFIRHNKVWWLAPIVIVLLLVGVLIVLSGTVIAPFIYPLF